MVIEIIRSVVNGSDSIEHFIGKRFPTHEEYKESWGPGEVEIMFDGGIYPIMPEEYVVILKEASTNENN